MLLCFFIPNILLLEERNTATSCTFTLTIFPPFEAFCHFVNSFFVGCTLSIWKFAAQLLFLPLPHPQTSAKQLLMRSTPSSSPSCGFCLQLPHRPEIRLMEHHEVFYDPGHCLCPESLLSPCPESGKTKHLLGSLLGQEGRKDKKLKAGSFSPSIPSPPTCLIWKP